MKITLLISLLIVASTNCLILAQNNLKPKTIPNQILKTNDFEGSKEVKIVWFNPNETQGIIGKYERLELGIQMPASVTNQINNFISSGAGEYNPFDPDKIDVRVILKAPSGEKITRYAFYYQPFKEVLHGTPENAATYKNEFVPDTSSFPWRFRFAPTELGEWTADMEIRIMEKDPWLLSGLTFTCVASDKKGYLKVSNTGTEQDRWMYYSETNEPFFAITNNISSGGACSYLPSQNRRQMNGVKDLAAVGGNFTRFELGAQSALPDWPLYNNYNSKQDEMYAFDRLVDLCEDKNIFFTVFRHHVEVLDGFEWDNIKWENNPYKVGLGADIEGYFKDTTVIHWQQKTLRYIFSRWGYSPNMTFYSYSELDRWYSKLLDDESKGSDMKDGGVLSEKEAVLVFKEWVKGQQDFIRKDLSSSVLFCHTPATTSELDQNPATSLFEISDVVGVHVYGQSKNINYKGRQTQIQSFWKKYKKPVIIEEMGPGGDKIAMFCCTGIEYHNSIWSTALMGGFGTGLDWWWDTGVHDFGYHKDLLKIQQFFANEDVRKENFKPQSWVDKSNVNSRLLENYSLVSENKEHVLGWVHNATYYWRNLANELPCLANIISGETAKNAPCYVRKDPYGYPLKMNEYTCLTRVHDDVYNQENTKNFDENKDAYTDQGGAVPIEFKESIEENPTFEISGLKQSKFGTKKQWYKIEFYSTQSTDLKLEVLQNYTQTLATSGSGKLKPHVPPMNSKAADYSYKVTYLGFYKK